MRVGPRCQGRRQYTSRYIPRAMYYTTLYNARDVLRHAMYRALCLTSEYTLGADPTDPNVEEKDLVAYLYCFQEVDWEACKAKKDERERLEAEAKAPGGSWISGCIYI